MENDLKILVNRKRSKKVIVQYIKIMTIKLI